MTGCLKTSSNSCTIWFLRVHDIGKLMMDRRDLFARRGEKGPWTDNWGGNREWERGKTLPCIIGFHVHVYSSTGSGQRTRLNIHWKVDRASVVMVIRVRLFFDKLGDGYHKCQ